MREWQPLGEVVTAQIQLDPLKSGERPWRTYHPDRIAGVDLLTLRPAGITAVVDGEERLDVHHVDHPRTRHRPGRSLSIGFTSHYRLIEERFGPVDAGCGAENLIVETDRFVSLEDGTGGFRIEGAGGSVEFAEAAPAQPCAPFTRHLLGTPKASVDEVAEDRAFLRDGMRGFVMGTDSLPEPVTVGIGDVVWWRPR